MTDKEVLEAAARELCKIRGLYPEDHVSDPRCIGSGVDRTCMQWEALTVEIKQHMEVQAALDAARGGR